MKEIQLKNNCSGNGAQTDYTKLPAEDYHYKKVCSYIEDVPDDDYKKAGLEARESFKDIKYAVRIHWGIYSMICQQEESWPYLKMTNEQKEDYNQLYKKFCPHGFDADEWMDFFKSAGFKAFAFTTKHHEGFSMFDTKAKVKERINWTAPGGPRLEECDLSYSVAETPFGRDIVKELCDSAHKSGMKIDLYFSHPDWYDADFRPYNYHPMMTPDAKELLIEGEMGEVVERHGKEPFIGPMLKDEQKKRMVERHRLQLEELLTNYGKIDMICLDQWMGPEIWPEMKKTIKKLRKIQPDVMLRARGIGNYGDFYTPEGFVPGSKENTNMPWMVIYPLASSFSFDPETKNYKDAHWIMRNLIDSVAKGGSFMVGIGPDKEGRWHPKAVEELQKVGSWLKTNGQAIYDTREREGLLYKEGDDLFYTRSKEGDVIYSILISGLKEKLTLNTVTPREGSKIYLIGYETPLSWQHGNDGETIIDISKEAAAGLDIDNDLAYVFKIEV